MAGPGAAEAMTSVAGTALGYAARGWHVFPLAPCSKRPAIPSHRSSECDGSDPYCWDGHRGWEKRATTDPDEINAFWGPGRHGVAIATGPSHLMVLDIDVAKTPDRASGRASLEALEARHDARLPRRTFTVRTPSGGEHRYFRLTGDQYGLATTTTGCLGPGLDTRGRGGYVVAPPTALGPGRRYAVTCDAAPVPVPDWLIAAIIGEPAPPHHQHRAGRPGPGYLVRQVDRYVQAAIDGETDRVVSAPIGERNQTLFLASIALGQLVGGGLLDETDALEVLDAAARSQIQVPGDGYDQRQATATIRSGFERGVREPRQVTPRP